MNSEIRTGKVSAVNAKTGMIRVEYPDKGKSATAEMPCLNYNGEYRLPEIGTCVYTAHLSNGTSRGVVIGEVWNKKNVPPESGKGLYRKDFSKTKGAAMARYSDTDGEYMLKAPSIEINGVNQTIVDGPKVKINASISIDLETLAYSISASKASIAVPEVAIGEAPEDGEAAAVMEVTNHCDVAIASAENIVEATLKSLTIRTMEDVFIESVKKAVMSAAEEINIKSEMDLKLEDSTWSTSLSKIMDRLAALDGDQSDRK